MDTENLGRIQGGSEKSSLFFLWKHHLFSLVINFPGLKYGHVSWNPLYHVSVPLSQVVSRSLLRSPHHTGGLWQGWGDKLIPPGCSGGFIPPPLKGRSESDITYLIYPSLTPGPDLFNLIPESIAGRCRKLTKTWTSVSTPRTKNKNHRTENQYAPV